MRLPAILRMPERPNGCQSCGCVLLIFLLPLAALIVWTSLVGG